MTYEERAAQIRDDNRLLNILSGAAPDLDALVANLGTNPNRMAARRALRAMASQTGDPGLQNISLDSGIVAHVDNIIALHDDLSGDSKPPCPVELLIRGYMHENLPQDYYPQPKDTPILPSPLGYNNWNEKRYTIPPDLMKLCRNRGGNIHNGLFMLGDNPDSPTASRAPLSQRLLIAALTLAPIDIPPEGKKIAVQAKTLLKIVYPNGQRRYAKWLPALKLAANQMYQHSWIPYTNSKGRAARYQPVVVHRLPDESERDDVVFSVEMPTMSGSGPALHPKLFHYGQTSRRCFNALFQLMYHWHDPGHTLSINKETGRWGPVYACLLYTSPSPRD